MVEKRKPRLKRPVHPMPDFVRDALSDNGLMEAYEARPPYQRNDYIGWITRARLPETRRKRLEEMLGDLKAGDRYMGMQYKPRRSPVK